MKLLVFGVRRWMKSFGIKVGHFFYIQEYAWKGLSLLLNTFQKSFSGGEIRFWRRKPFLRFLEGEGHHLWCNGRREIVEVRKAFSEVVVVPPQAAVLPSIMTGTSPL